MSILPSFMTAEIQAATSVRTIMETPKEYEIDFNTGQLTGRIVEGKDAIKVWIWACLHTERYRHAIYSWQYGTEFEQYIGETITDEYLQSDCQTEIEEALLVNPYITGVEDFSASMSGTTLNISFTALTTLGQLEVNENV